MGKPWRKAVPAATTGEGSSDMTPKASSGGDTPEAMSGYEVTDRNLGESAKKINEGLKNRRSGKDKSSVLYDDKPYKDGTFGESPKTPMRSPLYDKD